MTWRELLGALHDHWEGATMPSDTHVVVEDVAGDFYHVKSMRLQGTGAEGTYLVVLKADKERKI